MHTTVSATLGLVTYRLVSGGTCTREDNFPNPTSGFSCGWKSYKPRQFSAGTSFHLATPEFKTQNRPARVKAESVSREGIPRPWDPHSHPLRPVPGRPGSLHCRRTPHRHPCRPALLQDWAGPEVNTPRCACRPTSPSYLCVTSRFLAGADAGGLRVDGRGEEEGPSRQCLNSDSMVVCPLSSSLAVRALCSAVAGRRPPSRLPGGLASRRRGGRREVSPPPDRRET